jgi:hypothetical protein
METVLEKMLDNSARGFKRACTRAYTLHLAF